MDELRDYLELRKNIYVFLSKGFYKEATAEYLDEMDRYIPVFKEIAAAYDNSVIANGVEAFQLFRNNIKDKDIKAVTDDLAREFALLFLSTGVADGVISVIPHESVYLSPQGLTMQEQRDQVLEIYFSQSVGRNKDFKEPEDHISAEMGFMGFMSQSTADNLAENNIEKADALIKIQQDFLNGHLLKWAPRACDDIARHGSEYYQAVSMLTKGFLISDKLFIDTILNTEEE